MTSNLRDEIEQIRRQAEIEMRTLTDLRHPFCRYFTGQGEIASNGPFMITDFPGVSMQPILIVPPDTISDEDIKKLNDNGICTVVSKQPDAVKFLDPIPSISTRTEIEDAAIQLSRKLMSKSWWNAQATNRDEIVRTYVDVLVKGTRLDPAPSNKEVEMQVFNQARKEELERLAREEVRAERAAAREAKKAELAAKAAKDKKP
jgi:hypothetical protein